MGDTITLKKNSNTFDNAHQIKYSKNVCAMLSNEIYNSEIFDPRSAPTVMTRKI